MNAYERRIIHAEIQKIDGVSTNSVGLEGNRRVIVFPEGAAKPTEITKPEKKNRPRSSNRRSARTGRTDRRRTEGRTEKEECNCPKELFE